jgi:hypothetical protein
MMIAFDLLTTAAFLLLVLVGFASIIGAATLRERLAKYFAGTLFLAFVGLPAVSMLNRSVRDALGGVGGPSLPSLSVEAPSGTVFAVIVGHVVALLLVARRYVGVEARRREASERERARTRERVRLPPSGDGETS